MDGKIATTRGGGDYKYAVSHERACSIHDHQISIYEKY
jgi:hypothetical protein